MDGLWSRCQSVANDGKCEMMERGLHTTRRMKEAGEPRHLQADADGMGKRAKQLTESLPALRPTSILSIQLVSRKLFFPVSTGQAMKKDKKTPRSSPLLLAPDPTLLSAPTTHSNSHIYITIYPAHHPTFSPRHLLSSAQTYTPLNLHLNLTPSRHSLMLTDTQPDSRPYKGITSKAHAQRQRDDVELGQNSLRRQSVGGGSKRAWCGGGIDTTLTNLPRSPTPRSH
ncbi:hypothetical protein R3P38DRAFT_3530252 [Favolaschia claudopus]|uniref:Uncharacterized protein n=1 Tax=Favolaschia claudopus TaxID=2862362 RepID=A0AAW0BIP4_9AGAR